MLTLNNGHTLPSGCSAIVYNGWLIVAGGVATGGRILSSIEVMNIDTMHKMKTTIVDNECLFMGGKTGERVSSGIAITNVYSTSLSNFTSKIWKEISGLQTTFSTPLSISGSLFAAVGRNMDRKAVTAIHLYQPDTGHGEWVKVGDLPASCTISLHLCYAEY